MGSAYAKLNKHEDALRNLRESLEIKRKLGLKKGIAMSLDEMASSEDVLGKPDQALKDYKEAFAVWQGLGDKVGTGDVLNDLADFYVSHGQYDEGLKLFKESLQAEVDVGNQNNQGLVLNNIGNAYLSKADYQNARSYFEQALQLREKLKVPNNIADTLHNLAETSRQMGQYDLAVEQYLRALDLRRSTGDKRGAAIESSSMGTLFSYQGRHGAALSAEEDALKTFRELQERGFWLAEILGHYGNALAQVGRTDDAQKSLDEAMNVARELKNQATTAEIHGYQGDNAFYRGDYQAADGVQQGCNPTYPCTQPTFSVNSSFPFDIGKQDRPGYAYATDGGIDEVHVSTATRSPDWVATEFANESSPSTFYTVGGQATPGSAPTIQFLSPATAAIGTVATIQGYGFQPTQGGSTVTFNGVTATPTSWNDASIVVPVPAGATTGNVVVDVNGVNSNGVPFTVLPTTIQSLSPTTGTIGEVVTIQGYGFQAVQGASTVTFNGVAGTPTNWNDTSIVVPVPAGATTGNVVVTVGGVASNAVAFSVYTGYNSGYQYRQAIVLNHAKVPNTDQTDFPVLISGVYPYLANVSNGGFVQSANGYDIVFSQDPEGATKLDHEIDSYNPVTGTVNFWVRIPTLSHTVDTVIYLFYGNPSITVSQENKPGVWENGYAAVWHFGGSSLSTSDSTSNGNNGTAYGAGTVAGKIGGAASFTGSSASYINFGSGSSLNATTGGMVSAWVYPNSPGGYGGIFLKGTTAGNGDYGMRYNPGGNWVAAVNDGSWTVGASNSTLSAQTWVKLDMCWDGSNLFQYTNGALDTKTAFSVPLAPNSQNAIVGYNFIDGSGWVGGIDEVRVRTDGCRSSDWIATEYANESSPSTFYTVEGQSTASTAPTIEFLSPAAATIGATITIQGAGFQPTQGTSMVTFNGVAATPTSWNDASIIVPVPAAATTGNVIVTVGGVASNGTSFTVLPTPSITNLNPASGAVGTPVTITGTNFGSTQGTSTVTFNGTTATPTSWNATTITVPVPTGATTGNVIVTVGGGASNPVGFTVTPTLSITSLSPSSGMVGTFVTITGTLFGATQGASTIALNAISAAVVSWSNTSIVAVVPAGASSGPFSVTVNGQVAVSPSFTVTSLPTGWTDTDVGNVGQAGSATYSSGSGTFTVAGAGEGMIGGSADAMNFVYQTLAGDGSIVARVTNMQGGETGVMIRETLNPSATDAFACFSSGYGAFLEYRPTTGASGQSQITDYGTPFPYWVQLVRAGTTFTAFTSPDGVNWTQLGASATITMAQTVYIGLGVTGYGVLSTATFDSVSVNSTAAPAPLITGLSAETAFVGSQVTITGNNFGASQDGSVVFLNDTPMTINLWSNTSIVFTVPVGATSGPVVVSVAPSMNDSNPVTLEIVSQTLPIPWLDLDIGNVGQTGSATYSGGTFTVTGYGSGFGVGGGADAMHFVFQTLVGDGSIVAQLTSPPDSWPQIGIMIRETLNSNAAGAFVWYWPNQVILQARSATGGSVTSQGASSTGAPIGANYYPYWLKLVRAGNTFTSFISADGVNWVQGASTTISMAQTVYIGMASSNGQVATFDNVTVTVGTTPLISSLTPTVGTIGTPVTITGSNFGATQGASTVQFSGVPATSITSWSNSQIVVTVPITTLNGTISIVVTVNSIPSPITQDVLFTLFNPIITSISPTAGPLLGTITINGSGFLFGFPAV